MSKSAKLIGIELCRGLAAFAVILVHSGDETWGIPVTDNAIEFRQLFYFAVPFFIASYFYFATKKTPEAIAQNLWQRKIRRIVIPYLLWSTLFLLSKSFTFILTNNTTQLQNLWSEPVNIVFFGAASYHLYFLPLLISGTILLYSAKYLLKQNITVLLLQCLVSIVFYQWLATTENSFVLGEYVAFPHILSLFISQTPAYSTARIILINLAWLINCLSYFSIALLLNHVWQIESCRWLYHRKTSLLFLFCLILMNVIKADFLFEAILRVAIAYCLLLFGISISHRLNSNLIVNLGYCSFGIYLIHPYIKSIVSFGLKTLIPQTVQSVSIFSMLLYAIPTFILSWIVINVCKKNKFVSRYV